MRIFAIFCGLIPISVCSPVADSSADIKNVQYSIEDTSHTLITTWQVVNKQKEISCQKLGVQMFEIALSGRLKSLVYGRDEPDCTLHGDELVLRHDLTRFKIQPFRSYKLCISLPETHYNAEQCCPPFSLETFIPFNPHTTAITTTTTTTASTTTRWTSTTSSDDRRMYHHRDDDFEKKAEGEIHRQLATQHSIDSENVKVDHDKGDNDDSEGEDYEDYAYSEEYDTDDLHVPGSEYFDYTEYYDDQPDYDGDKHGDEMKEIDEMNEIDVDAKHSKQSFSEHIIRDEKLSSEIARLIQISEGMEARQKEQAHMEASGMPRDNFLMKRSQKSLFPTSSSSSPSINQSKTSFLSSVSAIMFAVIFLR